MRRTRNGSGALARGLALGLAILGTAACGGNGGNGGGPTGGFTDAMVSGRAFYWEVSGASPERGITAFAVGTYTDRREDVSGPAEETGTWSIDGDGKLLLSGGGATTEVTLVSDTATYLDVSARQGTETQSLRLLKLTTVDAAAWVGRHAVQGRELNGASTWDGVILVEAGGTGRFGNGIEDAGFTWQVQAGGVVRLSTATEADDLRRVVTSSGNRIVGEAFVGGLFDHILDVTLTPTASPSGFAPAMLEDRTFYWEDYAIWARTLISLYSGGGADEWYEEDWVPEEQALSWSLGAEGSLYLQGPPGWNQGLLLLEETATDFGVLWYDEIVGVLGPERLLKTVPVVEADVPGTWIVTGTDLDGTTYGLGTVTLQAGGTGSSSTEGSLTWTVGPDGALSLYIPSLNETRWMVQLATSTANAAQFGVVADDGALFWTEYLTLTR